MTIVQVEVQTTWTCKVVFDEQRVAVATRCTKRLTVVEFSTVGRIAIESLLFLETAELVGPWWRREVLDLGRFGKVAKWVLGDWSRWRMSGGHKVRT